MNPATDVGKKELPDGLRNRFTEYFIEEPIAPQKKVNRKLSFSDNTDENTESDWSRRSEDLAQFPDSIDRYFPYT